jgi:hypothetical protein
MKITNDTVRVLDAMIKAVMLNEVHLEIKTKSVFIIIRSPRELGIERTSDYFGELAFRSYSDGFSAIGAYAETPCTWSTCASWETEEEMKSRYVKILNETVNVVGCMIRNEVISEE